MGDDPFNMRRASKLSVFVSYPNFFFIEETKKCGQLLVNLIVSQINLGQEGENCFET